MTPSNLSHLIELAAEADPTRAALVGLNDRHDWGGVSDAVGKVAYALRERGIERGDRVAISCFKDSQSFLAAHGTLRAGGVVVPVDPMAAPAVARSIIEDAEPTSLVVDGPALQRLRNSGIGAALVENALVNDVESTTPEPSWSEVLATGISISPADLRSDDAAYIIYTSGSTGRPKGIVHTHGSALAYAERAASVHGLIPDDRVAGIAPLHFDQSTFELYAAPLARSTVVVMGEPHLRFPASFTERSTAEEVSVWYSVPSLFRQLLERGGLQERDTSSLRLVLYGGEVFPTSALVNLQRALPGVKITNVYGPAEVNECTNHVVTPVNESAGAVPIGRPWAGVDVRIVDPDGQSVGCGAVGELWISAPTMMKEYWGNPALTHESILVESDGTRWYKSGDLVAEDADGRLWFQGRLDNQVKLGGARIELEAVDAVVAGAPGVRAAVVFPEGDPARLVAVMVPSNGAPLDLRAVREHCLERLTGAAVPRIMHEVTSLPRTSSGKVDRNAAKAQFEHRPTAVPTAQSRDLEIEPC